MSLSHAMIMNAYSLAILLIIFLHSLRNTEKNLLQHKLFMVMLLSIALMLVADFFSRFDGRPDTLYVIANFAGNFAIFLLNPLLPSIWLLYVCCHITGFGDKIKHWLRVLAVLNVLNAAMLIISQFTGWFYTISADNVYSRGPLFFLPVAVTAFALVSAYSLIIRHRHTLEKRRFVSLLLFPLPTIFCMILQIIFYGTSLVLSGATLSLIIAFVTLQSDRLNTDFLTSAYNRKGLESYIRQKINTSTENRTFSGILLDLDNFKSINDTYGHNTGDELLISTVDILKQCLRPGDFIARFGGDEFVVILDISDPVELISIAVTIRDCFVEHISPRIQPLRLDVSMGCAVYDYKARQTAEDFKKLLDENMYQNKRANKAAEQPLDAHLNSTLPSTAS